MNDRLKFRCKENFKLEVKKDYCLAHSAVVII